MGYDVTPVSEVQARLRNAVKTEESAPVTAKQGQDVTLQSADDPLKQKPVRFTRFCVLAWAILERFINLMLVIIPKIGHRLLQIHVVQPLVIPKLAILFLLVALRIASNFIGGVSWVISVVLFTYGANVRNNPFISTDPFVGEADWWLSVSTFRKLEAAITYLRQMHPQGAAGVGEIEGFSAIGLILDECFDRLQLEARFHGCHRFVLTVCWNTFECVLLSVQTDTWFSVWLWIVLFAVKKSIFYKLPQNKTRVMCCALFLFLFLVMPSKYSPVHSAETYDPVIPVPEKMQIFEDYYPAMEPVPVVVVTPTKNSSTNLSMPYNCPPPARCPENGNDGLTGKKLSRFYQTIDGLWQSSRDTLDILTTNYAGLISYQKGLAQTSAAVYRNVSTVARYVQFLVENANYIDFSLQSLKADNTRTVATCAAENKVTIETLIRMNNQSLGRIEQLELKASNSNERFLWNIAVMIFMGISASGLIAYVGYASTAVKVLMAAASVWKGLST